LYVFSVVDGCPLGLYLARSHCKTLAVLGIAVAGRDDIIVLDKDVFDLSKHDFHDITVFLIMIDGGIVHQTNTLLVAVVDVERA